MKHLQEALQVQLLSVQLVIWNVWPKISNVCVSCSAAIKVNCNGFCGVTSKVNDTAWMVEEQYFNSTVSVADKGTLMSN